jgi:hypothetical protein
MQQMLGHRSKKDKQTDKLGKHSFHETLRVRGQKENEAPTVCNKTSLFSGVLVLQMQAIQLAHANDTLREGEPR